MEWNIQWLLSLPPKWREERRIVEKNKTLIEILNLFIFFSNDKFPKIEANTLRIQFVFDFINDQEYKLLSVAFIAVSISRLSEKWTLS